MSESVAKRYYRLTKPGIVYGNSIHVLVGYLLAYQYGLSVTSFIGVFIGVAFVIASACVVNNYMDRTIDASMKRTQKRALATGKISGRNAIIYAAVLGLIGFGILLVMTNALTALLGAIAYIWYVWIYGYAKRRTYYSTVVGSVPGALPIVAGYVAVSNTLDLAAWALFIMLSVWQIPHFYAIAVARKKEYANANVPIITAYKTNEAIRSDMIAWTIIYLVSIVALVLVGAVHMVGTIILLACAVYWLNHMVRSYKITNTETWGMRSFRLSLIMPIALVVASISTVVLA